jgi:hypothetical protein
MPDFRQKAGDGIAAPPAKKPAMASLTRLT